VQEVAFQVERLRGSLLAMSAPRHRSGYRRSGLGWLGAGRVIGGLSAGFALVAIGFTGLQTNIVSLGGQDGVGDTPARAQMIPDVIALGSRAAFAGGARPGVLPVAGVLPSAAPAPASPSGGVTPLPRPDRRVAAANVLRVVAGPQQSVAGPPSSRGALRDADRDGASDAVERRLGTDSGRRDTDGDGMPDGWEIRFGLNPRLDLDANADPDRDGVSNANEYRLGTNPHVADSDHNGVADGRADADGDGLPNAVEQRLGLDPTDGLTPPKERVATRTALNANAPAPTSDVLAAAAFAAEAPTIATAPAATDGTLDSDGDGLPNALEVAMGLDPGNPVTNGIVPDGKTDPDLDGLPSALEVALFLDPTKADTNGNGVPDGREDSDGDGLPNGLERKLGLNAAIADTDHDGLLDGDEDTDLDGMTNAAELAAGRDPATADAPAPAPAPVAPAPAPVDPAPVAIEPAAPPPAPAG
jgi:hypothetical protein